MHSERTLRAVHIGRTKYVGNIECTFPSCAQQTSQSVRAHEERRMYVTYMSRCKFACVHQVHCAYGCTSSLQSVRLHIKWMHCAREHPAQKVCRHTRHIICARAHQVHRVRLEYQVREVCGHRVHEACACTPLCTNQCTCTASFQHTCAHAHQARTSRSFVYSTCMKCMHAHNTVKCECAKLTSSAQSTCAQHAHEVCGRTSRRPEFARS